MKTINQVVDYYLKGFGISSPFNEDRGSYKHKGTDFNKAGNQDLGNPIYSFIDGVVLRTGYQENGAGHYLVISEKDQKTRNFDEIKLFHLQDPPNVKQGDQIKIGDILGKIGNTGNSTGSHLHMEVYKGGRLVDPVDYLGKLKRKAVSSGTDLLDQINEKLETYDQDRIVKMGMGLTIILIVIGIIKEG